jgi:hypothetical protein
MLWLCLPDLFFKKKNPFPFVCFLGNGMVGGRGWDLLLASLHHKWGFLLYVSIFSIFSLMGVSSLCNFLFSEIRFDLISIFFSFVWGLRITLLQILWGLC